MMNVHMLLVVTVHNSPVRETKQLYQRGLLLRGRRGTSALIRKNDSEKPFEDARAKDHDQPEGPTHPEQIVTLSRERGNNHEG